MKQFLLISALFISLHVKGQEPAFQPTNFSVSVLKPYSYNISFTGSGAHGYLVLRDAEPISDIPVDGVNYTKGSGVGQAKVFSSSGSTLIPIREVKAGATYHFSIFAYNDNSGYIDYKQDNPLTGTVTTPENLIGNYYQSLDQNSPTFLSDLKNVITAGKSWVPYSNYATNIVPVIFERDTVNFEKVIECEYSHQVVQYSGSFGFVPLGYSREHSLCKSWMPNGGATSTEPGADYHNLYLCNLNQVNSPRSNYPYGEVVNSSYTFMDFTMGTNNSGDYVAEPAEDIKGDVARSQFYMLVCYNGLSGNWGYNNLPSYGSSQNVDLLLNWHYLDPPDAKERAKHEYIYSIQNNRNPFIDVPEWVDCINFHNLTRYAGCVYTIGLEKESVSVGVKIFPNPVSADVNVLIEKIYPGTLIRLITLDGITRFEKNMQTYAEDFQINISCEAFAPGLYILELISDKYYSAQKLIIKN